MARALIAADELLPKGSDPAAWRGFESGSAWAPSVLTALNDRAAIANNEP